MYALWKCHDESFYHVAFNIHPNAKQKVNITERNKKAK
jgi:hypothetical protein